VLNPNTIRVRELPVGAKGCKSYGAYKSFLQELLDDESKGKPKKEPKNKKGDEEKMEKLEKLENASDIPDEPNMEFKESVIKDFIVVKQTNSDFIVDIVFKDDILQRELANNKNYQFEKKMKLAFSFATSNMHAHNAANIITKYIDPLDIIKEFVPVREQMYKDRKILQLQLLKFDFDQTSSRFRFVTEIMDNTININNKSMAEVDTILQTASPPYPKLTHRTDIINTFRTGLYGEESALPNHKKNTHEHKKDSETPANEENEGNEESGDYKYLLSMPISSFTSATLNRLAKARDSAQKSYEDLEPIQPVNVWLSELETLEKEYKTEISDWIIRNDITILEQKIKVGITMNPTKPIKIQPKLKVKITENKTT
jgi:DNA topoisomerase-2